MKKVLFMLSIAGMLIGFSSCKKDCVCKTTVKSDGDKVSVEKTKYYDLSDSEKDDCKDRDSETSVAGEEVIVKCR